MPQPEIPFEDIQRMADAMHGSRDVQLHVCLISRTSPRPETGLRAATDAEVNTLKADGWTVTPIAWSKVARSVAARSAETSTKVTMQVAGNGAPVDLSQPKFHDAAFWTESAVEKFFMPYYHRVLRPEAFRQLHTAYYHPTPGNEIFAFTHLPTSDYDEYFRAGTFMVSRKAPDGADAARREFAQIGVITRSGPREASDLIGSR